MKNKPNQSHIKISKHHMLLNIKINHRILILESSSASKSFAEMILPHSSRRSGPTIEVIVVVRALHEKYLQKQSLQPKGSTLTQTSLTKWVRGPTILLRTINFLQVQESECLCIERQRDRERERERERKRKRLVTATL